MTHRPDPRSVIKEAAIAIHNHANHFPAPEGARQMAVQMNNVSQSNPAPQEIISQLSNARTVLARLLQTRNPGINGNHVNSLIHTIDGLLQPITGSQMPSSQHRAGVTLAASSQPRAPQPPRHPSSSVAALASSGSNPGETLPGNLPRLANSAPHQALRQLEVMKSQRPQPAPSTAMTPVRQPEKVLPTDFDDDSWLDGLPALSIKSLQSIKSHPGSGLTISKKALNAPSASTLNGLARDFAPEFEAMGFRLLKQVGKGGMGVVILAKDIALNRDVAIKIITDSMEDFDLEAKLGAKFKQNDPVVYVSKAGKLSSGFPFLVMEYLENVTDLHEMDKDTETETKIGYCLGMAESVECLHEKEVLHRDLKPANFLIKDEKDGKVYASDFGLAVEFSEVGNIQETNEDGSPAIQGTPLYMPPEQAIGEVLTPAADVYSLGISMYEVLTGESPYPKNVTQNPMMMLVHLMRLKESPITFNDPLLKKLNLPENLYRLLVRMTDPKKESRPDIQEVKEAWKKYLETFSEGYRRNRKLALALKIFGPLALLGGLGAIVAYPVVKKNQRIEAFEANYSQTILNTNKLLEEKNWRDAIALLTTELERVRTNNDLEEVEKNRLIAEIESMLETANGRLAALNRARALMAQGDAMFSQEEEGNFFEEEIQPLLLEIETLRNDFQASELRGEERRAAELRKSERIAALRGDVRERFSQRYESIRDIFTQSISASPEVALDARDKFVQVNERECRKAYERAVQHYHRGEIQDTSLEFHLVNRHELCGLATEEQNFVREMESIMENWESTLRDIRTECVRAYQIDNFDRFQTVINEWKELALRGNRDSVTKLLELSIYLQNIQPPIVNEVKNRPGMTSFTARDVLETNPEWRLYIQKIRYVNSTAREITEAVIGNNRNPRDLATLQGEFVKFTANQEFLFQYFSRRQRYDEYCEEFLNMLDCINHLRISLQPGDFTLLVGSAHADSYISNYLTKILEITRLELPREYKIRLANEVRTRYSENSEFMQLVQYLK